MTECVLRRCFLRARRRSCLGFTNGFWMFRVPCAHRRRLGLPCFWLGKWGWCLAPLLVWPACRCTGDIAVMFMHGWGVRGWSVGPGDRLCAARHRKCPGVERLHDAPPRDHQRSRSSVQCVHGRGCVCSSWSTTRTRTRAFSKRSRARDLTRCSKTSTRLTLGRHERPRLDPQIHARRETAAHPEPRHRRYAPPLALCARASDTADIVLINDATQSNTACVSSKNGSPSHSTTFGSTKKRSSRAFQRSFGGSPWASLRTSTMGTFRRVCGVYRASGWVGPTLRSIKTRGSESGQRHRRQRHLDKETRQGRPRTVRCHPHRVGQTLTVYSARVMAATPKKTIGARSLAANRTPGMLRTTTARLPVVKPSPSPHKPNKPPLAVPARATSPAKQNGTTQRTRPPSSATFNPTMLPPKAPTYPTLRAPRHDENMLSVNGSPLANPYTLGLGWFTREDVEVEEEESHLRGKGKAKQADHPPPKTLRHVNSIVIRRDPSVTLASSSSSSSPSSETQPPPRANGTHARANSQTQHPASRAVNSRTLVPPSSASALAPSGSASALVSIPIKDGHLLEFDPLATSPRALDTLVGITESAKKQAKAEMARLVKEAVRKWVIE